MAGSVWTAAALTPACMSTALTDMDGVQDDVVKEDGCRRREKAPTTSNNSAG